MTHSSNKTFVCKQCGFISTSKFTISRHHGICNPISSYSYECRDCNSKFRFENALVTHAQIVHQNKKPFVCSCCNLLFSRKHNLTKHMKVHTGKETTINLGEIASTDIKALESPKEDEIFDNNSTMCESECTNKASTYFENE
ncbi:unnamed protein product, partial [Meganyctiphanes norvegica]